MKEIELVIKLPEDKRFRKLYRKLSNKDIPPARTGCGMSFEEKNRGKGTIRL